MVVPAAFLGIAAPELASAAPVFDGMALKAAATTMPAVESVQYFSFYIGPRPYYRSYGYYPYYGYYPRYYYRPYYYPRYYYYRPRYRYYRYW